MQDLIIKNVPDEIVEDVKNRAIMTIEDFKNQEYRKTILENAELAIKEAFTKDVDDFLVANGCEKRYEVAEEVVEEPVEEPVEEVIVK